MSTKKSFGEKTPLKIGMLVGWHIHGADFAEKISSYPDCQLVSIYDENPERGQAFANKYACSYRSSSQELLNDPDIDAVIICSATSMHAKHIILAANQGKHIYVEKAPFSDITSAEEAAAVVKKHHVHFTFSDPIKQPDTLFAKEMMESGKLGAITGARVRAVHNNALTHQLPEQFFDKNESGGGVLIDMGFKCFHTLTWFLGKPISVTSSISEVSDQAVQYHTEDNAAAIFSFSNGALGILETSWVSPKFQNALDVFGTTGTIHIRNREVSYCLDGKDWVNVPKKLLPPSPTHPLRDWIDHIRYDIPDKENTIDEALLLTKMLTSAYLSNAKPIQL